MSYDIERERKKLLINNNPFNKDLLYWTIPFIVLDKLKRSVRGEKVKKSLNN